MVREARFSCDEFDGVDLAKARDRLDDRGDEVLETFTPEATGRRNEAEERQSKRVRRAVSRQRPRRHLAGADWIEAVPPPKRSADRSRS